MYVANSQLKQINSNKEVSSTAYLPRLFLPVKIRANLPLDGEGLILHLSFKLHHRVKWSTLTLIPGVLKPCDLCNCTLPHLLALKLIYQPNKASSVRREIVPLGGQFIVMLSHFPATYTCIGKDWTRISYTRRKFAHRLKFFCILAYFSPWSAAAHQKIKANRSSPLL